MNTPTRYDTSEVPVADRFAYWQDAVCNSYVQLGCETKKPSNFSGLIEIARHSVLSISQVSGTSQLVKRRKSDIRRATDAYFLLSLQTDKTSRVTQFGKTALLNTGDMALYCSSSPYELQLTDNFSQSVVQLPKDKLIARLPNAEMLAATKIDGQSGIGKLVQENILAFSKHANTTNPVLQSLVQETLIDLIATGLAAQSNSVAELSSPEQQLMLRVKSFITNNLDHPTLDRTLVADQVGLSVRRINAIFAKEESSLSGFIRQSRLDAVASELTDVRYSALSISEIACKYGFGNFQHFSNMFRKHFGTCARDYRAQRD